jgi:hypothetical protein
VDLCDFYMEALNVSSAFDDSTRLETGGLTWRVIWIYSEGMQ